MLKIQLEEELKQEKYPCCKGLKKTLQFQNQPFLFRKTGFSIKYFKSPTQKQKLLKKVLRKYTNRVNEVVTMILCQKTQQRLTRKEIIF